jgi:ubiquinone/menaquinone biosynthesis C-methylase UbiE
VSAPQAVNTTYEPFSLEPVYIEANRAFVQRGGLQDSRRILDIACGTGTVSELILESAPGAHLNGIDLDPVQIDLSLDRFTRLGYEVVRSTSLAEGHSQGKPVLHFDVADAGQLPFDGEVFDAVTMANAIHLVADRDRVLSEIVRVLKPGGIFGFNSTFYGGAMPEGSQRVYLDWIQLAGEFIRAGNDKRVAAGDPPIKRVRGTQKGAFTHRWYTIDEWTAALAAAGLQPRDVTERGVPHDARCLALIGAYGGFAEVLLSGYPVEIGSEALQACAGPALTMNGLEEVPRNNLEIWSSKRS